LVFINFIIFIIKPKKMEKYSEKFKRRISEIHGNKLIILGEVINYKTNVLTKCNICDYEWMGSPKSLLSNHGCPKCGHNRNRLSNLKTHEQYLKEILNKHGDKISILSKYVNANSKIIAKCNICQCEWSCESKELLKGHGCPDCGHNRNKLSRLKTHEQYLIDINKIHKDRLTILGNYVNSYTRILTKCNICQHEWEPVSNNLLKGRGCPICNINKGELIISEILNELLIDFKQHYIIENLKNVGNGRVEFDFYLPNYNLFIEYDGMQHYKPIKKWGGVKRFEQQVKTDEFKNKYCIDNNIRLIRIPYTDLDKIDKNYIINLLKIF